MGLMHAMANWIAQEPLGADETAVVLDLDLMNCAVDAATSHEVNQPISDRARLYSRQVRLVGPMQVDGGIPTDLHLICKLDSAWQGGELGTDHVISVTVYYPNTKTKETVGAFSPKSRHVGLTPAFGKTHPEGAVGFIIATAYMLDLINTPAFVTKDPLPRATRRRIDRNSGTTVSDRVRVVSWNLTKPKLEAGETAGCGRHMPLHYTRGHWRQCAAHLDRAQLHDDGVHRMWIEGFWSGHPAYGIVRSIHAPKL